MRDPAQSSVLQGTLDDCSRISIATCLCRQIDGQRGRLDVLGNVDDLRQAGHSQGHVLGGHTGIVERVQRHLSRRLTDGLGCHCSNAFSRVCTRLQSPEMQSLAIFSMAGHDSFSLQATISCQGIQSSSGCRTGILVCKPKHHNWASLHCAALKSCRACSWLLSEEVPADP